MVHRSLRASKRPSRIFHVWSVLTSLQHPCFGRQGRNELVRTWYRSWRCILPSLLQLNIRPNIVLVIVFVTLLHGLTPRTGVYIMNVRIYPIFGPSIPYNDTISVADDLQDCPSYLCCDNGLGCTLRKNSHRQPPSQLCECVRW
jgi:hypothetical protein